MVVEVEGDTRQVAEILQQSEQGKNYRHRQQYNGNDPSQNTIDSKNQRAVVPPRSMECSKERGELILQNE